LVEVVADGLGEAGGVDGHDLRIVHGEERVEGGEQVGLTAEDRGTFRKGTGAGHDQLLVLAGAGAALVGVAVHPMRTVAERQAAVDPKAA
jgi:hypothetical protein